MFFRNPHFTDLDDAEIISLLSCYKMIKINMNYHPSSFSSEFNNLHSTPDLDIH